MNFSYLITLLLKRMIIKIYDVEFFIDPNYYLIKNEIDIYKRSR